MMLKAHYITITREQILIIWYQQIDNWLYKKISFYNNLIKK